MNAKPTMGGYRILPTDTASYDIGKVVVYYLTPLPAAVDGFSGKITYKWSDISYETLPHGEILAEDFVLAQDDEESMLTCRIEIYNKEGGLRARSSKLNIPIVNGGITTVTGNFYSMLLWRRFRNRLIATASGMPSTTKITFSMTALIKMHHKPLLQMGSFH